MYPYDGIGLGSIEPTWALLEMITKSMSSKKKVVSLNLTHLKKTSGETFKKQ